MDIKELSKKVNDRVSIFEEKEKTKKIDDLYAELRVFSWYMKKLDELKTSPENMDNVDNKELIEGINKTITEKLNAINGKLNDIEGREPQPLSKKASTADDMDLFQFEDDSPNVVTNDKEKTISIADRLAADNAPNLKAAMQTPELHLNKAIEDNDHDLFAASIEDGADINQKVNGVAPLFRAERLGRYDLLIKLLDRPEVDIDIIDVDEAHPQLNDVGVGPEQIGPTGGVIPKELKLLYSLTSIQHVKQEDASPERLAAIVKLKKMIKTQEQAQAKANAAEIALKHSRDFKIKLLALEANLREKPIVQGTLGEKQIMKINELIDRLTEEKVDSIFYKIRKQQKIDALLVLKNDCKKGISVIDAVEHARKKPGVTKGWFKTHRTEDLLNELEKEARAQDAPAKNIQPKNSMHFP